MTNSVGNNAIHELVFHHEMIRSRQGMSACSPIVRLLFHADDVDLFIDDDVEFVVFERYRRLDAKWILR